MQIHRRLGLQAWPPLAVLVWALACGSEEPPRPSGPSMTAQPAEKTGENVAPVLEGVRFEPREPVAGQTLRAVVKGRDANGDRLEIRYEWKVAGRRLGTRGPEVEIRNVSKGARIEVVATASDGTAESEPFRAETRVGNRRPLLRGLTLQPLRVISPGESVTAVANARDPDGDRLEFEYRWRVNGQRVDEDGPSLTTAGLDRGASIQVRVTASDGEADSEWIDSPIVKVGNAAPLITSAPGVARQGVFRYTLEARDPEGDRNLRYRLVQGPEGMTVDPVLGEVVWQPRASQAGIHLVQVAVRDSDGASTVQEFEVDVAEEELPAGG